MAPGTMDRRHWRLDSPELRPIFREAMDRIDRIDASGGTDIDGALLAAMKGQIFESPRGPVLIDAQTRDIVQDIYIRKVEKKDGQLYNVEFDVIKDVKDPGKSR